MGHPEEDHARQPVDHRPHERVPQVQKGGRPLVHALIDVRLPALPGLRGEGGVRPDHVEAQGRQQGVRGVRHDPFHSASQLPEHA